MKRGIGVALVLAACLLTARAQQGNNGTAAQNKQAEPPAPQPKPQQGGNPFPTDTTNIPVMPSHENPTPDLPANAPTATADQIQDSHYALSDDSDPVTSPDGLNPAANSNGQVSSSNMGSLDSILPPPGEDQTKKGKKGGDEIEDMPKETAAQDISVGKYYLDNKNWRAALSRYQSALVLAPEDPEVYWGLAESQRHMGDFANARANYEKVMEYDPGSKHAKEAAKALRDPQLANAKPVARAGQPQR